MHSFFSITHKSIVSDCNALLSYIATMIVKTNKISTTEHKLRFLNDVINRNKSDSRYTHIIEKIYSTRLEKCRIYRDWWAAK